MELSVFMGRQSSFLVVTPDVHENFIPSTPSPRHPVTSSPRHLVTPLPRYPITPSPRHPVTSSPRHPITLSPRHPVTSPLIHPIRNKNIRVPCTIIIPVRRKNQLLSIGREHRECVENAVAADLLYLLSVQIDHV